LASTTLSSNTSLPFNLHGGGGAGRPNSVGDVDNVDAAALMMLMLMLMLMITRWW